MKLKTCCLMMGAGAVLAGEPEPPKTIYVPANESKTLQLIVDAANPGDEIIVAAGIYDLGGRQVNRQGPATRLVVDKPLTIRSEEGPDKTILAGGPSTRCLYLTNGAEVIGFMITGGETCANGPEGNKFTDLSGGGVWSESGGTITDCLVVSNTALWYGGGLYGGSAIRCEFRGNSARRSGGAASHARLGSCLLAYNLAGRFGGGAQRCNLFNCTVTYNRAEEMGGGTAFGTAQNTAVHYNQTLRDNHNYYETGMSWSSSWPTPPGTGNLGGEPGFKNSDAGMFSLQQSSLLIDRGTNTFLTKDLVGSPRILDGNNAGHLATDIGAFEFVPASGSPASESATAL